MTLYVVATPIGNLSDMTFRAIETLRSVDLIAAEDTRHSQKLLQHFKVSNQLIAFHEHNERQKIDSLITELTMGKTIAVISDAGTPLISDPGYVLVKKARELGIDVVPIPGCSAFVSALCVAGIATDKFSFVGFLAPTEMKRQKQLCEWGEHKETLIFYESCHRIIQTLNAIQTIFTEAERRIFVAREMTKLYEDYFYGSVAQAVDYFQSDKKKVKGEFVIVISGKPQPQEAIDEQSKSIMRAFMPYLPLKQVAALTSQVTGANKKILYEYGVGQKNQ